MRLVSRTTRSHWHRPALQARRGRVLRILRTAAPAISSSLVAAAFNVQQQHGGLDHGRATSRLHHGDARLSMHRQLQVELAAGQHGLDARRLVSCTTRS